MTRRSFFALLFSFAGLRPSLRAVEARDVMLDRLNRFNETMRDFTERLRQHQFPNNEAKLLSKLWRDVERSGEWPAEF